MRILGPFLASAALAVAQEPLTEPAMQQAYQKLTEKSVLGPALTDAEWNRAALLGMQQLHPGIFRIFSDAEVAPPPRPLLAERLTPKALYLRLGQWQDSERAQVTEFLEKEANASTEVLIWDLRWQTHEVPLAACEAWLGLFLPAGLEICKIHSKAPTEPKTLKTEIGQKWEKQLVLLTDSETGPLGEVCTQALQTLAPERVLTVGTATPGTPYAYEKMPLGNGLHIEIAVQRALFGENLLPKPFLPRHAPLRPQPMTEKHLVAAQAEKSGMAACVIEQQRPVKNEAALMAKTDPEIPYQIAQSAGLSTEFDAPPPRDTLIQFALDAYTTQAYAPNK